MNDLNTISSEIEQVSVSNSFISSPELCCNFLKDTTTGLKILHVNIRSISCNFNHLLVLMTRLKISLDVILLSECWLSKCTNIPSLPGYESHASSFINQNDGVIAYTKKELKCSVENPSFNESNCLVLKFYDKVALVALYRSPSYRDLSPFLNSLDALLLQLTSYKTIALIGDININIVPSSLDAHSDEYLNTTASHAMLPAHTFPTRLTNCLDHVFLKSPYSATTLVLDCPITDHLPVLLFCDQTIPIKTPKKISQKTNIAEVISDLNNTDFSPIFEYQNPNLATESLVSLISTSIKSHTLSLVIPSRLRIIKPWITPGLLRCIRHRDNLSRICLKNPKNDTHKLIFLRYRNHCNNLLKKLKQEYETSEFQKAKSNPKATWQLIRQVANLDQSNKAPASELLKLCDNPTESVSEVNQYFATVGSTLASKIRQPDPSLSNADTQQSSPISSPQGSMVLYDVDKDEIDKLILNLKDKCAVGYDGISSSVIKAARHIIAPVLVHIFNLCLSTGVFPNVFKTAIVHPIFKSGDSSGVVNYRPISVLSTLSKIFEKVINARLTSFLTKYHILAPNQFGFRNGRSTDDAVLDLTDTIANHLNNKRKTLGIFLDLSKAFDTVSIPRLLTKLERLGIRGVAHDIFRSYLENRKQVVKIENYTSTEQNVTFGVPQGSVLGPTLFLIYVNELCQLSLPNSKIIAYADDTALVIHGNDWSDTFDKAESALSVVMKWLNTNLLTLNISKTKCITFTPGIQSQPPNSLKIKAHSCTPSNSYNCNCTPIDRTDHIKYLGVIIDNHLKWKMQINSLVTRIRRLIYVFKKLRGAADFKCLITVYLALAQSVLGYCVTSWGGAQKTPMLRLERAQRAVLKVLSRKPIRYPTSDLYTDCNVLTVRQIFILQSVLRKHNLVPYDPNFSTARRLSDRVCKIVPCRVAVARRQFTFISPKMYNKINRLVNIYHLKRNDLRKKLTVWLKTLSYNDTEKIVES